MHRLMLASLAMLLLLTGVVLAVVANRRANTIVTGSLPSVPDEDAMQPKAASNSEWLTEYTLTERSGKKFRSQDLAGKVHVVNFFFTTCPTVCRTQTGEVQALQKEFGPRGVVFLSITCDPEKDTPVVLSQYAKEFQADPEQWLFLTGELPYLRRVAAEKYFLALDRYTHSESLLVVDANGQTRGRFSWKDAKELAKMKKLLSDLLVEAEQSPAPGEPEA